MDFLALAKKRYSARTYLPKSVEPELLDRILEAGRVAPTAANRQPQRVLVLQQPESLAKVSKTANTFQAPLVLVICGDESEVWVRKIDGHNTIDIDATIVTDHMMLAAADLGLDSVWICHFNAAVLRQELQLPAGWLPVNILAVGYAKGEPASPDRHTAARKPLNETVFYEHP